MLCRYIRGDLPVQAKATIGVEFATRTVPLASGGSVKAQIWDTAGQERYRSITSAHYRRAVGALLVYDVTNRSSFYNCKKWLDELRASSYDDIVILLIANKVDLTNTQYYTYILSRLPRIRIYHSLLNYNQNTLGVLN